MRAWWSQLFVPQNETNLRSRYDCSLLCLELPIQNTASWPPVFLSLRIDRAAYRTMGADGALHFDLGSALGGGMSAANELIRELTCKRSGPGNETRTLQKRPPVHRREHRPDEAAETWTSCSGATERAVWRLG